MRTDSTDDKLYSVDESVACAGRASGFALHIAGPYIQPKRTGCRAD